MAKILVCVAWPYASGPRHLGHAVSTFIPADIFARYHRMKGDEVLMVGGSDMHGTPVTVRADEEGVPPNVIAERYHALHLKNIEQLGVRYDLYWNTADPHHKAWVQEIFLALKEKGHVYEAELARGGCEAPADPPPPGLGPRGPRPGLREEADLCVVRGRDGISAGDERMVPPPQPAGRMERLLVRPRGAPLLLRRERQHRVPHDHLARDPPRIRRQTRPAVRRDGDAIPELLRREDERGPREGRLALRPARTVRSGSASLLRRRDDARDQGHGLRVGGLRAAEQQRAPRRVRELRPPREDLRGQELRPCRPAGGLPRCRGQEDDPRDRAAMEQSGPEPGVRSHEGRDEGGDPARAPG